MTGQPGRRMRLRRPALLLAVAAVLLSPACGGGGGGGPTAPPPPPPQTPSITFTASGQAGAGSIALVRQGQGSDRLSLQVSASQVTGLYGVAFDLRFPSAALDFDGFDEGTLLGSGGADTSIQVVEAPPGNLVVGATRLNTVPGVNGSGVLLTLHFNSVASGNGSIVFDGPQAFDRDLDLLVVQFVGGSVQVVH